MQDLVDFVARALVEQPEEVVVESEGPRRLRLTVAPEDLGRVIGRRGRTAKALRALLRASYGADLEITESDEEESDSDSDELEN